jgi:FMN phosphatase YigB (HAD superfamily)
VRGILFDVGGTLWPNVWPEREHDVDLRVDRVLGIAPHLDRAAAQGLVAALRHTVTPPPDGGPQDTDGEVAATLRELRLAPLCGDATQIRRAMCLPALGRVALFEGAERMLRDAAGQGFRIALISNAVWRDGAQCLRDFMDLGLGDLIDASFSSVDVGHRKPHPAMFEAALAALECEPAGSLVVGDSESNDIIAGRELGMFTIRVAIEEPVPSASRADRVVTSLDAVRIHLDRLHAS